MAHRRVFQQGENQRAVAVERCGATHNRHDAVGAREIEQVFDVGVVHAMGQQTEPGLCLEFAGQPIAPALLVGREAARAQIVPRCPFRDRIRRDPRRYEAVIDASARGWLHQAGGVADREEPIAIRA